MSEALHWECFDVVSIIQIMEINLLQVFMVYGKNKTELKSLNCL